jgi:hypothetical protein
VNQEGKQDMPRDDVPLERHGTPKHGVQGNFAAPNHGVQLEQTGAHKHGVQLDRSTQRTEYDKPTFIVQVRKGSSSDDLPTVTFHHVPVRTPADYTCSQADLLTFEQIKKIAKALDDGDVIGELDGYRWQHQAS